MHICFVCREYPPSLRGGGIASYIKESAHGLCSMGHKVTVVCASDDTRKEFSYKDGKVNVIRLKGGDFIIPQCEKISFIRKFRIIYRFHSYRKKILKAIQIIHDIDIIETPEYGAESYYLNRLSKPVVIRLHAPTLVINEYMNKEKGLSLKNWHIYWQGLQEYKMIKKGEHITSCSLSLKNIISNKLQIIENKIKVIYNPIQTKAWNSYQHHNFTTSQTIRIVLPGAIYNLKGGEDLIHACETIHKEGKYNIELSWIGKKGKFAEYIEHRYKYPWLHLPGMIPREELLQRYSNVDIVCMPSWWENMPMACIEAMLTGNIIVASNVGGLSEIITDGVNGFLVPPNNSQTLAEKILKVFELSEEEKATISLNATRRIKDAFSLEVIMKQQIAYYEEVIENYKKK